MKTSFAVQKESQSVAGSSCARSSANECCRFAVEMNTFDLAAVNVSPHVAADTVGVKIRDESPKYVCWLRKRSLDIVDAIADQARAEKEIAKDGQAERHMPVW